QQLQPGQRIKNYVLEEQLGKGASGEVWKANDGVKTVALKLMNPQLLSSRNVSKHLTRLQREIEALNRLQNHPNIPSIFDYDLNYERPYLAMQFIGGASYDKLIKSGEMMNIPLERRLNMIRELAMALYAAHSEDIIHRDLKPANVSGTENPYLLDFSVALPEADLQKTQSNIGTKLYMPWDGIPDKLGDIYGFGLVAYEIIFGRHAIFTPDDNQMLRATPFMPQVMAGDRIKNRQWHLPSRIPVEELPPDLIGKDLRPLDEVFQKALGSRAERYNDPRTFASDLRRAIEEGIAPQAISSEAESAPAAEPLPTPEPEPEPPAPQPEPQTPAEYQPTVVEEVADMSTTPLERHDPSDVDMPTVVEPLPESPPPAVIDEMMPTVVEPLPPQAEPADAPPDDSAGDDGQTVIGPPDLPPPTLPVYQPATRPPEQPEPARRPLPSLEPERKAPPPPMPVSPPPAVPVVETQLEPEPPRTGRSPLIYLVALVAVAFIAGIGIVAIISGTQGGTQVETLTPGAGGLAGTDDTPTAVPPTEERASDVPATQVAMAASEVLSATPIPPTATRRPTDTPLLPTETPVPPSETSTDTPVPTATSIPTETPVPATDTSVPSVTPVPPSDTPVPTQTPEPTETPLPPTATRRPTDTAEPPTNTAAPTATPVPPSDTPVPTNTDTAIPPTDTDVPTATRRPTDTPTPVPPTATRRPTDAPVISSVDETPTGATVIPPTATRIGDEATAVALAETATPTATPEGELPTDLGEVVLLLRQAITGDTYQCSVFNAVYEHIGVRLEGEFEDNTAYEQFGDVMRREMGRIYRGFCRDQDSDEQRLPRRYEGDNSDLNVLLDDILRVLALTPTPTPSPTS
ncbi:MAG TPA: protein kinase, partial [Spirillospora sp.]|nr:protein kinase [Spirillospora sp.]